MLENILLGFTNLLAPMNIIAMIFGIVVGIVMGALPGLTSTLAVALLVPFTFAFPPTPGLIALAAVYTASTFGGSISAILINIPGTPASVATTWDGQPLVKQGKAGKALIMSTISSCFGGFVGALALLFLAPPLAQIAIKFQSPEIFSLSILGLSIISSISFASPLKGLISCVLGLIIATIGQDPVMGFPRYTFGIPGLLQGAALLSMMIGLFAIPEVIIMSEKKETAYVEPDNAEWKLSFAEIKRSIVTIIRGSLIGVVIGIIPAASPDIAAYVSYNVTKQTSKDPDSYGKGNLDGIAAAESANNAVAGGSLIPLLTLSIPGAATAAVFLGALYLQGLLPGPMLFTKNADIIYTLFVGFAVVNLIMLPIGIMACRLGMHIVRVPVTILAPVVLALSVIGSYSISFSVFDVWVMFGAGVLGYLMKKLDFPVVPIILALILGPLAEQNLSRTIQLSDGSVVATFFKHPIALVFIILSIISVSAPYLVYLKKPLQALKEKMNRRRGKNDTLR